MGRLDIVRLVKPLEAVVESTSDPDFEVLSGREIAHTPITDWLPLTKQCGDARLASMLLPILAVLLAMAAIAILVASLCVAAKRADKLALLSYDEHGDPSQRSDS